MLQQCCVSVAIWLVHACHWQSWKREKGYMMSCGRSAALIHHLHVCQLPAQHLTSPRNYLKSKRSQQNAGCIISDAIKKELLKMASKETSDWVLLYLSLQFWVVKCGQKEQPQNAAVLPALVSSTWLLPPMAASGFTHDIPHKSSLHFAGKLKCSPLLK